MGRAAIKEVVGTVVRLPDEPLRTVAQRSCTRTETPRFPPWSRVSCRQGY
ncbi:hypothetical protein ACIRPX_42445 [Streptomyces sp. NPDC101225]